MVSDRGGSYVFFFLRMHLALKAYQELLLTVNEMDCSQDENIRQSSNVIKSKMQTVRVHNFDSTFVGYNYTI